jgi:hypothetical protein
VDSHLLQDPVKMELTLSSNESSQLRLVTVKISETRVGRGALKCSIAASEL